MTETALSTVADLATAGGFVAAAAGAFVAYQQIRAGRKAQLEALAYQTYSEYLKLAIEFPRFAAGDGSADPEKYAWYVAYMLNACEQILDVQPNSCEWQQCVEGQIRWHEQYIRSDDWFSSTYADFYSDPVKLLIAKVRGNSNG